VNRNAASARRRAVDVADLSWLANVEVGGPELTAWQPIWIRQPAVYRVGYTELRGHQHPYCEINLLLAGQGSILVGRERMARPAGSVLLLGPGLPHQGYAARVPNRGITAYFLPSVLLEAGPGGEGLRLLQRLTAPQPLRDRLLTPPPAVLRRIKRLSLEMAEESERPQWNSRMRLRSLLVELLLVLVRWEESTRPCRAAPPRPVAWDALEKLLRLLHGHFAEPVYARDLAAVAGMSRSRMQVLLQQGLGMPWVRYLQSYRVHRAAALLVLPGYDVTRAAFEVGFESLSHFNQTFRQILGVTPRQYLHRRSR
jgi:AraC-like DNA-binding protein